MRPLPLQERLEASEAKAEAGLQEQREARKAAEAQAFQLEVAQWGVKGKLQLAAAQVARLDVQLVELESRLAERLKELSASEERSFNAALGKERAVAALARAERQEAKLREDLCRETGLLSNQCRSTDTLQEKTGQLQWALASSQEDCRVMQVTGRSPTPPPGDPPTTRGHGLTGQAGGWTGTSLLFSSFILFSLRRLGSPKTSPKDGAPSLQFPPFRSCAVKWDFGPTFDHAGVNLLWFCVRF